MKTNHRHDGRTAIALLALILGTGLFWGCGDSSVYPFGERERIDQKEDEGQVRTPEKTVTELPGSSWELAGFETHDAGSVMFEKLPDGIEYTLTFGTDGRAGGMADCKGYDYGYELSSDTDEVRVRFFDPAPQIAMICSNHQVEAAFYEGMNGATWLVSTEKTLRIYYGDASGAISRALYFVAADGDGGENPSDARLLEFVPFPLILHAGNPYTLEPQGAGGNEVVRIEGDILYAPVGYSGGCEEHTFTLYADSEASGVCADGEPCPQTLHLIHSGDPDMCEAYITETHAFDLTPLKKKLAADGLTSGTVELTVLTLDGSGQSVTVTYTF